MRRICLYGKVIFWGIKEEDFKQLKDLTFSTTRYLNLSKIKHIVSRYVGAIRKHSYASGIFTFIVSITLNVHFHFQTSLFSANKLFN